MHYESAEGAIVWSTTTRESAEGAMVCNTPSLHDRAGTFASMHIMYTYAWPHVKS